MKTIITVTVEAPEEDSALVMPGIEHALDYPEHYPPETDVSDWNVIIASGADRIAPFGEAVAGDQVLSDGELLTVESICVGEDPRYPGFPIAFISGTGESGRPVALSPPATSLTAIRSHPGNQEEEGE